MKAAPVARALSIETQGKRLAQVVAEVDATDAADVRAGVMAPGIGPVESAASNPGRDDALFARGRTQGGNAQIHDRADGLGDVCKQNALSNGSALGTPPDRLPQPRDAKKF